LTLNGETLMLVTDKQYYMDDVYVSKLDLMIKRMQGTDDNVLPIDGDEGQGKTEFAVGTCYYVANKMGRKYDINNIFFDLDKGIEFAGKTKEQIVHLDEGALGLLSNQWWSKNQKRFLQLVMIARKKKHFIVICIPKFYKLNQYIIEERAIGLIHVYSRKNLQKGRFCYYTKNAKERLYQDWKRKKYKNYKKYYSFHGSFVKAMEKVFTQEQIDDYEHKKDLAIMNITKTDKEKEKKITKRDIEVELYNKLRKKFPKIPLEEWKDPFGVSKRTLNRYSNEEKRKNTREIEDDKDKPTNYI